jgi:hypothetical protein
MYEARKEMLHRIPVWNRHQSAIAGYWLKLRRWLLRSYWLHFPFQIIAAWYCYHWYRHTPIPNQAVLAITVLSIAMVLVRMRSFQKVIYLVLILCFVKIENCAMVKDRDKFAADQALRTSQENARFDGIAGRLEESAKMITGGDSYGYIDFTRFITPEIVTEGKYPLHGVTVRINDFKESDRRAMGPLAPDFNIAAIIRDTQADVALGDLPPYHGQPMPETPLLKNHGPRDLDMFFSAFNGQWQEHVCLRVATNSTGTTLAGSYLVRTGTHKLKEWTDGNFPNKADGTPDCHHVMPQDKPPKTAP